MCLVISSIGFSSITLLALLPLEDSMVTTLRQYFSSVEEYCFSTSTMLSSMSFNLKRFGKVR